MVACNDANFCCKNENGDLVLKKEHAYYPQIQGQLALTGADWCDFVLYTHRGLIIQRIPFDAVFWQVVAEKLTKVYFDTYLPVAAGHCASTSCSSGSA